MLKQILDEVKDSGGVVVVGELSERLGVESSAMEGMLDTLVRLGKLREESTAAACGSGGCRGCSCCRPCGRDGLSTMRAFVPTDR